MSVVPWNLIERFLCKVDLSRLYLGNRTLDYATLELKLCNLKAKRSYSRIQWHRLAICATKEKE